MMSFKEEAVARKLRVNGCELEPKRGGESGGEEDQEVYGGRVGSDEPLLGWEVSERVP